MTKRWSENVEVVVCKDENEQRRRKKSGSIPFSPPDWFLLFERNLLKPTIVAVDCQQPPHRHNNPPIIKDYHCHGSPIICDDEYCYDRNHQEKDSLSSPQQQRQVSTIPLRLDDDKFVVEEGRFYDVQGLLASDTRDCLVKFVPPGGGGGDDGNNQVIRINELSGKYVCLYLLGLSRCENAFFNHLLEIYNHLSPQGLFEVVFVAVRRNDGDDSDQDEKSSFDSLFSKMPWLAIPYEDHQTRRLIWDKFKSTCYSCLASAAVFAPDGELLQYTAEHTFRFFGAEAFPFTRERHNQIALDDDQLLKKFYLQQLSLTQLLGDHVISCDGKNLISTSYLQSKNVGLYFFEPSERGIRRTKQLVEMWENLRNSHGSGAFEVVVIHLPKMWLDYEKTKFLDEFGNMPWYTLVGSGRKLCRVFNVGYSFTDTGYLIFIQPDAPPRTLNYFALDIYNMFGIDAYPFTLEHVVMVKSNYLKETQCLGKLLSPSAPLRRGCSGDTPDIMLSSLFGKRVMLLFATHSCYESGIFMPNLRKIYLEMDGKDNDFEIIYMSADRDTSGSSFTKSIKRMPWLVHSFSPDFVASLAGLVFDPCSVSLPAIAAFGPDWNLVGKESSLAFKQEWSSEYPFIEPYVVEDVVRMELSSKYGWDLNRIFCDISSWN